jgi:creatinine amidohydrolase
VAGGGDGLALLRDRVARIPSALLEFAAALPALERVVGSSAPRRVLATGLGSSAAHARFLAHALSQEAGLPARYVSTGALAAGPLPGGELDALVVFSQGLSPNARFALTGIQGWGHVVLVTAEPAQGEGDRAEWRRALEIAGVAILELPAAEEYGTLVRVVGPMLGLAAAALLARAFAEGAGVHVPALELDFGRLSESVEQAPRTLDSAFDGNSEALGLLGGEVALVAAQGYGELLQNLRTKLLEGTLGALPPLWDGLELAHGGHQRLWASERALILHLSRSGVAADDELAAALTASFDSTRHCVLRLETSLPGVGAALEHEAIGNALLLRWMEQVGADPADWPGRGRDAPLYDRTPSLDAIASEAVAARSTPSLPSTRLEELTSPEFERARAAGLTSGVIALASIEQHGPHLPLATDAWIAGWLADRVCARLPAAVSLPVLPFGCASEHMDFPGTLSLEPETWTAVLADLLRSLAAHGFEDVLLFSAHGGNVDALRASSAELREAAAPLRLAIFSDHDRLWERHAKLSLELGSSPAAAGHHAGELESSIVAALRPTALRRDRLEAGVVAGPDGGQSLFYPSLRANAPSGVVGDPRGWSAARAEPYLAAWVDELVACWELEAARDDEK